MSISNTSTPTYPPPTHTYTHKTICVLKLSNPTAGLNNLPPLRKISHFWYNTQITKRDYFSLSEHKVRSKSSCSKTVSPSTSVFSFSIFNLFFIFCEQKSFFDTCSPPSQQSACSLSLSVEMISSTGLDAMDWQDWLPTCTWTCL